jgi:hypothetical protein
VLGVQTCRKEIPQHYIFEGLPEETYKVIFNEVLHFQTLFTFTHADEKHTITGIACIPVSKNIQSPLIKVVGGKINSSFIKILLVPKTAGQCAGRLILVGKVRQEHQPR